MITIPLLIEIEERIKSEVETGLGIIIPDDRNWLNVNVKVTASELKLYYLAIAGLQKNMFPDTADSEAFGGTLERAGRLWLGRNPFPATGATYQVQVSGTIGAVIPISTVFMSDDTSLNPGKLYVLNEAFTLVTGTDLINLVALEGGVSSKLNLSDTLTCTQPLTLVSTSVTVTSDIVSPIDAESLEDYRKKILEKIRLIAGSWSAADYRLVAGTLPGVRQIYAYAFSGHANEINVWVEGTEYGVPTDSDVITAVENATELVRPLGVFLVHYAASPINEIEITITEPVPGTITVSQKSLIATALGDAINEVRPFIAAADIATQINDTFDIPKLYQIILNTVSVAMSSITFTVDAVTEVTYTADEGRIPFVSSIIYA